MNGRSTNLTPSRRLALDILLDVERRGAFARDILNANEPLRKLDPRDAGFTRRLVLGVIATSGIMDDFLLMCSKPKTRYSTRVRCALRIALFEMLYLGTPANVAVSQGVELARSQSRGASGLANAVLRKAVTECESFLDAEGVDPLQARIVALARTSGIPVWLARKIESSLGLDAAQELFSSELEPAPVTFHLNPLRENGKSKDAIDSIIVPGCIEPSDPAAYIASGVLSSYNAVASDASAQLIATAATRSGSCLEIGAGRGTKTFIMVSQGHRLGWSRDHVAVDLYPEKCRINAERILDAGLAPVRFAHGDARDLDAVLADFDNANNRRVAFDTVFLDAPCSGTGTMRRHPEIPWRLSKKDVEIDLPELQFELLCSAASRVAPGGELYYATCSVLDDENMDVVLRFQSTSLGQEFSLAPVADSAAFKEPGFSVSLDILAAYENSSGCYSSHPALNRADGHFCARFIRAF